ncbi:hypothetical protein EV426DRAFT_586409 [Tirmania nivea]|nr:hypothetical protein EV426DRAFT_586409 [Tirmania nivea]
MQLTSQLIHLLYFFVELFRLILNLPPIYEVILTAKRGLLQHFVTILWFSTEAINTVYQLNPHKIFDYSNPNIQKFALRTSVALLLFFALSSLAVTLFSFKIFIGGELASQDRSITWLDIILISSTLTFGHFIIDFISPDREDPILRQVDRMGTCVIRLIALRHKALDIFYSYFQSAEALVISAIDICESLWHHTKWIVSCLCSITSSMLSTIVWGLNLGLKTIACLISKTFLFITEITQIMFISLSSNLQLLCQCSTNLMEQRNKLFTHIMNSPPILAAEAANNAEFKKPPVPTEGNGSGVKTIAIVTSAAHRAKTLAELIRESRAADELESRTQIEKARLKELEEAKWKQLDKVNQVTELAMEMVRQGKTHEHPWTQD